MIVETSGPCIVVFTGDSTFLYSMIKWTVNVTRFHCFHCYKFCLSSNNLVVSRSQISGSQSSGSRAPGLGSQVLILDYAEKIA